MAAKIVSGAGYQRRKLGDCLPISTPFALHIFPSHFCNLKCSYCLHSLPPDKLLIKDFQKILMEFDLFSKCIEDASQFPEPLQVLIFAGWGEPLTHPRIADMIRLAKQKNIAERIEIVSNGILLTHSLSTKLVEAGLDRIRFSIQGITSEKYHELAGARVDFGRLVDNIAYLYTNRGNTKIYIKTVETSVPSKADKETFYQIFGPISDEIAIENIIPVIQGIDHSKFGNKFENRHCGGSAARVSVCPFPFYMVVVHPDGSYAPCCSPDRPVTIGNLTRNSLREMWEGDILRNFRIAHLKGNRGDSTFCRACLRPQYDIQEGDNLDSYREQIQSYYVIQK